MSNSCSYSLAGSGELSLSMEVNGKRMILSCSVEEVSISNPVVEYVHYSSFGGEDYRRPINEGLELHMKVSALSIPSVKVQLLNGITEGTVVRDKVRTVLFRDKEKF